MKLVLAVERHGTPLGVYVCSAKPSEHHVAEPVLASIRVPRPGRGRPRSKPRRVIADKGYDSDPLRQRMRQRGIDWIAPYRCNSVLRRYEDKRKLRRYRKTLENRALHRMGAKLPARVRGIRPHSDGVSRLRVLRVFVDYAQAFMKPALCNSRFGEALRPHRRCDS